MNWESNKIQPMVLGTLRVGDNATPSPPGAVKGSREGAIDLLLCKLESWTSSPRTTGRMRSRIALERGIIDFYNPSKG
jgi:hypothetical protein